MEDLSAKVTDSAFVPPPLDGQQVAHVPPPLGGGQDAHVPDSLGMQGIALVPRPLALRGIALVPGPLGGGNEADVPRPFGVGQDARVPQPLGVGQEAHVPRPLGVGGVALVPNPLAGGQLAYVPVPLGAGDHAHVPAPLGCGNVAPVQQLVRVYDPWLSFLVLVGAVGQWLCQNETPNKPGFGMTKDVWNPLVERNIQCAWREFQLAWEHRGQPVRHIDLRNDPEAAHIDQFARLVIELGDLTRMKGIHFPQGRRDDVNAPLIDRLMRDYVEKHFGLIPFQRQQPIFSRPPMTDYV